MRRSVKLSAKRISVYIIMLIYSVYFSLPEVFAQDKSSVRGKIIEARTNQPVQFATIALVRSSDSSIAGGSMSDENGAFNITAVQAGAYILKVSSIGYKPMTKNIELGNGSMTDAGSMYLQDTAIILNELVIEGERIKAKSEADRTTYLMTQKLKDASATGVDVLRNIPGVQVDLMQNISLEGSRNILIYVDGRERDKTFLGQLDPKQIDKIEIISSPPSNYDGSVTGAINIVLKKDSDTGVSGKVLMEIPTSSTVYIFPAYSLNYSVRKLNLYTSYNGEMTYLDLHESHYQKEWNGEEKSETRSDEYLRQKDWSHRFHYGFDYFFSERDQLDFYAFYNPFSRELDGSVESHYSGIVNTDWQAKKEDTDKNTSAFYSMFYKHSFERKGKEITADLSTYTLKAENRTDYTSAGNENETIINTNITNPEQNILSVKLDYAIPILNDVAFSTGSKAKFQKIKDASNNFSYSEKIFAAYFTISLKKKKYDLNAGLRAESSAASSEATAMDPVLALLPYSTLRYKLSGRQNLQLSYNRTITRPNVYQLNPFTEISDPHNISKGNPFLQPELRTSLYLEHSIQFKGNYVATRLFFNRSSEVINSLTFINDTSAFETQFMNLGTIDQYGLQLSGSLKFSILTINPYFKAYGLLTMGNETAVSYSIPDRRIPVLESGLSAIASFKHELTFSCSFQYSSPKNNIQGSAFSDMLYLFSLDKGFKERFKIGIVSVIPFTRSFTYAGSETNGPDFYSRYDGKVQMSAVPVWFRFSYQFSAGRSREKVNRSTEDTDNMRKKGF